jgi:hypothetical protein
MSNFRKELSNYQIIPRDLIFDSSLSDRARFIYCYMSSKPDDWDFYLEPMAKEVGYSKDTLRKYISELVTSGWLVRGEQANSNGVFGAVEYTLKASKFSESESTVSENFRCGKNPTLHNRDYIQNRDTLENIDCTKEKNKTKVLLKKKSEKDEFEKFQEYISTHAPRVANMKKPFTREEFESLKKTLTNVQVRDLLLRMENYRDLHKNLSAYRTLLNWSQNDKGTKHKGDNLSAPEQKQPKNGGWKKNILND